MTTEIFKKNIKFQLDSGSDLTIMNYKTWKILKRPTIMKSTKLARTVTGKKINFEGEVVLPMKLNKTFNGVVKKNKSFHSEKWRKLDGYGFY